MNPNRLLDLFCELVRIESPSRREAAMAGRCADELRSLGFEVRFDGSASQTGSDTGNLIAHLPGTAGGAIVLSAHMDTVQPCAGIEPVVEGGVVRSAGDTILSADDKAGVRPSSRAFAPFSRTEPPAPTSPCCSPPARSCIFWGPGRWPRTSFLPARRATCSTPTALPAPSSSALRATGRSRARFSGRAAHAGVEPEKGASAIAMAAAAVAAMPLGRIDEATTANIGTISGGCATNVVPDACALAGECRSLFAERAEAQKAAMTAALEDAAARFGGAVEVEWTKSYDAVLYDEDDELVRGSRRPSARRASSRVFIDRAAVPTRTCCAPAACAR